MIPSPKIRERSGIYTLKSGLNVLLSQLSRFTPAFHVGPKMFTLPKKYGMAAMYRSQWIKVVASNFNLRHELYNC